MRFFPGQLSPTTSFVTPAGSRTFIHHEARFNGERTIIVETGRSDIQDAINSFAPYCDITYMLSRLKIGDTSVVCKSTPMYGDFTGLPSSPHDIFNLVKSAESSFAQLSSEDRQACNNDFRVWLSRHLRPNSRSSSGAAPVSDSTPTTDVKDV